jgi:hypothetical protein
LEVAADDDEVDCGPVFESGGVRHGRVDVVEFAMALAVFVSILMGRFTR